MSIRCVVELELVRERGEVEDGTYDLAIGSFTLAVSHRDWDGEALTAIAPSLRQSAVHVKQTKLGLGGVSDRSGRPRGRRLIAQPAHGGDELFAVLGRDRVVSR